MHNKFSIVKCPSHLFQTIIARPLMSIIFAKETCQQQKKKIAVDRKCIITLSVPVKYATTWVTRSSIWLVHTAPNCSAICHNGCKWGLVPSGITLLKRIRQPSRILCCSAARMFLTSASSKDLLEKKFWCILSITYFLGNKHVIREIEGEVQQSEAS